MGAELFKPDDMTYEEWMCMLMCGTVEDEEEDDDGDDENLE